ncbi:polysaccharide deacetylase family protein [Chryseobacterium caseinilyticum]|uniref:Polysaccharide deacetylase family protein n=1 Tax=Chryseobacterium caseinilyticum TaxID=2771428 RepID=A0ABR8ZGD1_9FLAO|nr:polysaccharide deacetylase family protein [Chryseobacterium caseinilyticum]MBD8083741.1 polysaccharide deacetylase family protein [Chryseobacterium caseinilyticum]
MLLNFIKGIFGVRFSTDLRILMYHQIMPEKDRIDNDIVISVEKLDEQLKYIGQNFKTVFFSELEEKKDVKNKLVITFDDGYYNNLVYLIPLLIKYNLKATICIPTELIEKDLENIPGTFMSFDEIKSLSNEHIEIALHSHSHKNYAEMSIEETEKDIRENIRTLEKHQIQFSNVLVYPYGKFPKKGIQKRIFFELLEKLNISAGLRIGNDLSSFPWRKKFEIKRINMKGSDSFATFKRKLRFGKIKL